MEDDAKKYWNSVADTKEFSTPFQIGLFKRYVGTEACILDYGCGYGRTLGELKDTGYSRLFGVDFSERMIARCREKYPGLNLAVNRGEEIPFPDDTFDAVVLLAVFTCIHKDEEQDRLVGEVKRVLKSGGAVYINDFMINTDERYVQRYDRFKDAYGQYGVFELQEMAATTILRHHSEDRIRELTDSFEPLAFERQTYTTMNGNRSNGFYYIGKNRK